MIPTGVTASTGPQRRAEGRVRTEDGDQMAKPTSWKITDYDGRLKPHPQPEDKGTLILHPNGKWELRFSRGFGRGDKLVRGGVNRHPVTVEETLAGSCRVTIGDSEDPTHHGSFDLNAPATELEAALAAQAGSVAAIGQRQQQIATGSWWLAPKAFRALGFTETFSAGESRYLGGWSGYAKTHTANMNNYLVVDKAGVSFKVFKTLFTIPWDQVHDIAIEGPESASKRVTVGRALALGVFSLAAKKTDKSAVVVVSLKSGEEAIFDTRKFSAGELRAKLAPITSQLRRGITAAEQSNAKQAPAAPATSVADELKKLGELKEAGLLTEEEFEGQKAKLLS